MRVARITDTWSGTCVCHESPIPMSGIIVTGAPSIVINGKGAARLHSVVVGRCGHRGIVVRASATVLGESKGLARIGDTISGCCRGTIVGASENVESDTE